MELTPRPIRGKRKRTRPASSNPPSSLLSSSSGFPGRGKKLRPLSTVVSTRSQRCPKLDLLPAEILESILLYSSNLALPRASSFIGLKLSGKATLVRLLMSAFHDTWDQWFGAPRLQDNVGRQPGKDSPSIIVDGDPVFQSAVLGMPWAKMDLILQAQQTWADTYARNRRYQHYNNTHIENDHPQNDLGGSHHVNTREYFEADYQAALAEPILCASNAAASLAWGFQDVHPRVRVPTDLMVGPWDEEQQRRLFWLIRGGAKSMSLDPDPSWEIKWLCLRNSLINPPSPNVLVLNLLLVNVSWNNMPREVLEREVDAIQARLDGSTASGTPVHEAYKVFRHTLRAGIGTV